MTPIEIISVANQQQENFRRELSYNGHESISTFWADFTIAELCGGSKAIKDTYKRCQEWKKDVKMWCELVLVLNWKIWQLYDLKPELAKTYDDLWRKASDYAENHFKGEDLNYYYNYTD